MFAEPHQRLHGVDSFGALLYGSMGYAASEALGRSRKPVDRKEIEQPKTPGHVGD